MFYAQSIFEVVVKAPFRKLTGISNGNVAVDTSDVHNEAETGSAEVVSGDGDDAIQNLISKIKSSQLTAELPMENVNKNATVTAVTPAEASSTKEQSPRAAIPLKTVSNKVGRVTLLIEPMDKGVIDNAYIFRVSQWSKLGLKQYQQVTFTAYHDPDTSDWYVTDLKPCLTEEQLVVQERAKYRTLNYKIKQIKEVENEVIVGPSDKKDKRDNAASISIPMDSLPKDYPARTGDWLTIKIKADAITGSPGDLNVSPVIPVSVTWTQQKTVVGYVTKYKHYWCIDDTISYTPNEVENNLRLTVGNKVRVVKILSDQKDFKARACNVEWIREQNNGRHDGQWSDELLPSSVLRGEEMDLLFADKNKVRVSPKKFISFRPVKIGLSTETQVTIQNTGNEPVLLKKVHIGEFQDVCKFHVDFTGASKEASDGRTITLAPGFPFTFKILSTPIQLGRTRELCIFDFGDFKIARWLSVTALTNDDEAIIAMRRLQRGQKSQNWKVSREDAFTNTKALHQKKMRIVRGPMAIPPRFFISHNIPSNNIPTDLFKIYRSEDTKALEALYPSTNWHVLDPTNYTDRFHVALWFEEAENDILRRQYDLHNTVMVCQGDEFIFDVPNLKEFHPQVLLKDPVRCYDTEDTEKRLYAGYISKIDYPNNAAPKVHIKLKEDLHRSYAGEPFSIQFCLGRMTFKRCHFAIDEAMKILGADWLFPQEVVLKPPRIIFFEEEHDNVRPPVTNKSVLEDGIAATSFEEGTGETAAGKAEARPKPIFNTESNVVVPLNRWEMKLQWFNTNLNKEQKSAVKRILRGQGRPLPYIIFGPPGTGKTVTVVEAILQIYFMERSSRILITVPSNAGADLIAEQLVATNRFVPGDFVRLNGYTRSDVPMSELIADFCVDGEDLEVVSRHRLIIATVATAGQFFSLGLDLGHFSHVFIDEAGYCMEPEALIPAVLAAVNKEGQIILAGDPKQLGPVLMCDIGVNEILNKSFLERLMELPIYSRDAETFPETKYNPAVLTMLVRCYRTHETLLKLPSELFYDNELVSEAAYEDAYELSENLDFLPKRGIPLIFHGIQGSCFKEKDSPSWYNTAEVNQVVKYVRLLKNNGVQNKDIGVITPYRKQVDKIKFHLLSALQEDDIPKVASVEEFQGGERKVMLISTVRTEYTDLIRKKFKGNKLNFIFSKKRFNVAVTRAKALMIIIGDPHVLFRDDGEIKCWSRLLRFACEAGVYLGCDKPIQLEPKLQEFARQAITGKENVDSEGNPGSSGSPTLPPLVGHGALADKNGNNYNNNDDDDDDDDEETGDGYGLPRYQYYSRF